MSAVLQAAAAAEAIRELTHETTRSQAYSSPIEVDAVVVELTLLAQRLPQALHQAQEWLVYANGRGAVAHDTEKSAWATVARVSLHLSRAASSAEAPGRELNGARQLTARLMDAPGAPPVGREAHQAGGPS